MPRKLARNEWDFSKVREGHERAAWEWEIERSAFLKGKRWLDLTLRVQEEVVEYFLDPLWPIHEHNLEHIGEGYMKKRVEALESTSLSLHLLEIDCSNTPSSIKKALSRWVDNNCSSDTWLAKRSAPVLKDLGISQEKPKGGRPPSYIGQLVDLAIYRLDNAGISRKQGVQGLQQLARRGKIEDTPDNKLSDQHWQSAVQRISKTIPERKKRHFKLTTVFDLQ